MTTTKSRRSHSLQEVGARRIEDFLTGHPICVTAGTPLDELAETLEANGISGVPVIDDLDRVVGVISRTDLVRYCRKDTPEADFMREGLTVGEVMCPEPITALPSESVGVVAQRMVEESVHRVVIIDEDDLVMGVVTSLDLLNEIPIPEACDSNPKERNA